MTSRESNLAQRIRDELTDLQIAVDKARRGWAEAQAHQDQQDLLLDAVALNLHSIYSGLESLFELIARHIDGSPPAGKAWHQELLKQMQHDVPNVRPAVISANTHSLLDEYRRFRHLVRNVYTVNLNSDKLKKLIDDLPDLWGRTQLELNAFAGFLDALDQNIRS